jgi:hypothetical protein
LDLGEAITFPFIIYFLASHETNIQMAFFPGLPSGGPEIPKVGTPTTLEAHNFVCRPTIEMRYEKKIVGLVKSFPTICDMPPENKEIEAILDF